MIIIIMVTMMVIRMTAIIMTYFQATNLLKAAL
jgi:hypothetical protein